MHVLAVGSSVIDLFLEADRDFYETGNGKVSFNLGDKIPSDLKKMGVGGNGANVSVGLTRLEHPTTFYTYLGGDILAREIEESLSREGVEVVGDKDRESMTALSVILDFDSDRIIFSNHKKRDHVFSCREANYDFIYLTSVGETWEKACEQVLAYSKENNIPIAFSPGSSQLAPIESGLESMNGLIKELIKSSKVFFSNKEEGEHVLGKENMEVRDILTGIKNMGPEIVSITDANRGAYAIDKDGKMYHIKTLPDEENQEKTGAGDAYASGFFAAILSEKDITEAMRWGTFNAASVMREIGAEKGLLTKSALDKMLVEHNNLKAEEI